MKSPFIIHDQSAVVAPQYFGTLGYYAVAASYSRVYIDGTMSSDKRFKSAHRCLIVDTRDEIMLTVPVAHPHGPHDWNNVAVSTHGHWWTIHLNALESAYGRTPFFEFYIDKFAAIFDGHRYIDNKVSVASLDKECDSIVRDIIGMDNDVVYLDRHSQPVTGGTIDLRKYTGIDFIGPKYYQLRADVLGFRHGLSILDLIFNMGPEAGIVIREAIKSLYIPENILL